MSKLAQLTEEFNDARQKYLPIGRQSLELQWEQGRLLNEMKVEVKSQKKMKWLDFLKKLEIEHTTATRYMKIAREVKKDRLEDL